MRAVARWQCMASTVTVAPAKSSISRSAGTAVISLPSAATVTWPSTGRSSAAHALTRCKGEAPAVRSNDRRKLLPSTATTPDRTAANAAMKRWNAAWNAAGSRSRKMRLNVSWLGGPPASVRNSRSSSSFASAKSAISTQLSAPHRLAHSAMNKTFSRSCCRRFPVRGSSTPSNAARNRSIVASPSREADNRIPHPNHFIP